MPRKIINRSPHREVGVVNAGHLLSHGVEHESHLERRFIITALSCPVVKDIVHQPFHMWLGPDQTQRYTPDFLVTFTNDDQVVIEVKPEVFVPKHQELLDKASQLCKSEGRKFLVVTDKHIDAQGLSARAILLMRYGRIPFSQEQILEARQLLNLDLRSDATLESLVAKGINEELIWHMVAIHQLRTPIGLHMSSQTPVSINLPSEKCHDEFCSWFGIA